MSINDKVKDIIVKQLGVNAEEVTESASFVEDMGADSLDTVELVMELEKEFDMEISDEEAANLKTVGDAIKFIECKVGAEKSSGDSCGCS